MSTTINWKDFAKVDIRVGTIVQAEHFKEAKNPSYKIHVDFGDKGILKTSAQITSLYTTDELIGKQVIRVVNFPPKQIATTISEFLILGAIEGRDVILLSPDRKTLNGLKIG